jgi:hypothetical protein
MQGGGRWCGEGKERRYCACLLVAEVRSDDHGVVTCEARWREAIEVSIVSPAGERAKRNVRSYGSSVSCSWGLMFSSTMRLTSEAKTASAGAVESMQLALIETTTWPPFFRKWWALRATIRAWSGWATSAKMTSTWLMSMRYLLGYRASSMMGMTFVRFLAMLMRSRPERCENSTA